MTFFELQPLCRPAPELPAQLLQHAGGHEKRTGHRGFDPARAPRLRHAGGESGFGFGGGEGLALRGLKLHRAAPHLAGQFRDFTAPLRSGNRQPHRHRKAPGGQACGLTAEIVTVLPDLVEQETRLRRKVARNKAVGIGAHLHRRSALHFQIDQSKALPLPAVRRHQPQPVTEVEPVGGMDTEPVADPFRHAPDHVAECAEPPGVDQRRILPLHIESERRPPGRGGAEQLFGFGDKLRPRLRRPVQQHPVGAHGLPYVVGRTQPPLHLQRSDAEPPEFRDQRNSRQVTRRKQEALRPFRPVAAAAGLFAFAPVAAPAAQRRGEQTAPRQRAAERAVHEHLQLHR